MAHRLVNVGLVLTLVLGCWGGVLAAVVCPHMGCETAASAPAGVRSDDAGHGDHGALTSEDHSGHHAGHEVQAAEMPAHGRSLVGYDRVGEVRTGRHDLNCTHCVGRQEAPPSPNFEPRAYSAKKGVESTAPVAALRVEAPRAVFPREITPAQHAPPGGADRHLLLSVFRI